MSSTSLVYLKGDPVPFTVASAPDVVATAIERGRDDGKDMVRLDQPPDEQYTVDGDLVVDAPTRPLYVDPFAVGAIAVDERED